MDWGEGEEEQRGLQSGHGPPTTRLRFHPEAMHRGTVREPSCGPGGHCLYSETVGITGHGQAGDVLQYVPIAGSTFSPETETSANFLGLEIS